MNIHQCPGMPTAVHGRLAGYLWLSRGLHWLSTNMEGYERVSTLVHGHSRGVHGLFANVHRY